MSLTSCLNNTAEVKYPPYQRFYYDNINDKVRERYTNFVKSMLELEKIEYSSLFKKMNNIVKRNLLNYQNDFYVTDIGVLRDTLKDTNFIWVVRPYGTHLIELTSDLPMEERLSYLKAIGKSEGDIQYRYYYLTPQGLKKISVEQAEEYIANSN